MSIVAELIREMSLWRPQSEGLEVLDDIITAIPLGKNVPKSNTISALASLRALQTHIKNKSFDLNVELAGNGGTDFPSFCFAIATGGGKTRLMGACIAYLYNTKGFKNFFILSKGETIYNKHRYEDFDPASPKYVFKGLSSFPSPRLIDGDNYERFSYPDLFSDDLTIYLFNIEKIFNERTDVEFKFHRFHENLGGSFADIIRSKPDLVFLMDESHNIRAEKSLKAVNALNPILGLEFTATPKARNVIYTYSLKQATADGLVKRARVVTRKDDDSLIGEKEDIKLRDGILIHERKKATLETYCRNNRLPMVKPRVLICAPPSEKGLPQKHIERIKQYLQSDEFLGGKYSGKVIAVHQGSDDEQITQLLELEKTENDIEIVVHVNKLKEGWDVKTIYTIIPLRASVSDILTVQTIGRGLRLPFGKQVSRDPNLTDEESEELLDVDTLDIISHEKYSAVLAKVKASRDWDVAVGTLNGGEKECREIRIDGDPRYKLKIPVVKTKFSTEAEIELKKAKVSFDSFEDVDPKLVSTELGSLEEKDYESILEECYGSLMNFFVRVLIEESYEFDIRDKERLQEFVASYIDKAKVPRGKKEVVLFKHRGKILEDILAQIQDKTAALTTTEFEVTDDNVEFRAWWRNVPKGYKEKHKDSVLEEDLTGNIIGGYSKSIFSRNVLESKQEKWFADIIDIDGQILRWIRPPRGQAPITYKSGNYNPDFIVETSTGLFFVVEVKARDNIKDEDVQAKAKAAVTWCRAISEATGNKWEYKLIPHDLITPNQSFVGVISSAVKINA